MLLLLLVLLLLLMLLVVVVVGMLVRVSIIVSQLPPRPQPAL